MANGRRQHNLTVLADGTVLATGGNSSGAGLVDLTTGVYAGELWNPATGRGRRWRPSRSPASTTRPRCCCPTAACCPRAAASAAPATPSATWPRTPRCSRRRTCSRPTAPASSRRGRRSPGARRRRLRRRLPDRHPDAAAIRKVALVRLGAVTHSVNMEQRYVPLLHGRRGRAVGHRAGQRQYRAARRLHALPRRRERRAVGREDGHRQRHTAADTSPPTAPSGMTATAAGSTQVKLCLVEPTTDNVGVTSYRVKRCQGAGYTNVAAVGTPTGDDVQRHRGGAARPPTATGCGRSTRPGTSADTPR